MGQCCGMMRYIAFGLLCSMLIAVAGYGQRRGATSIRKPNVKSNRRAVLEGVTTKVPLPLVQAMARDDESIKECVNNFDVNTLAEYLSAQQIDLNGDGTPELMLYSNGSPGTFEQCLLCGLRRCNYWIYRSAATNYELLLKLHGPEEIFSLETSSNGYRDLEVVYPPGIDLSVYAQTYRFDGRQYQEVEPNAPPRKVSPPRIGIVKIKLPITVSCSCGLQLPNDYRAQNQRFTFISDYEVDGPTYMNVDGEDLKLKMVSTTRRSNQTERLGLRFREGYTAQDLKVRLDWTVTKVCKANALDCEVTWYAATITVTRNGQSTIAKTKGTCGC